MLGDRLFRHRGQAAPGSARTPATVRSILEQPRSLPLEAWAARHRGILILSAAQVGALFAFGAWMGFPIPHLLLEVGLILVFVAAAAWTRFSRRVQSVLAGVALVSTSAVLVHLSGGYIEAHFHFFVMLGVISLYEDWSPYGVAVAYVALHHGLVGTFDPHSVYNHPAAFADPWLWAGIHAFFVLSLSAVNVVLWRVNEETRARAASVQLEARRQTERNEKMAAMGSLVSGVAHEIRTPLTYIQTNLHLLAGRVKEDPVAKERLAASLEGIERINGIVGTLRRYTKMEEGLPSVASSLDGTVAEAIALFQATNRARARVELRRADTGPILHRPQRVHQIVLNLVENAAAATPGGRIEVEVGPDPAGGAFLRVRDDGPGLPDEVRARLFQPLVTTRSDGTGLGLSIVKRIADEHQAAIEVRSEKGKGTEFAIHFPAAPVRPSEASSADARRPPAAGGPRAPGAQRAPGAPP